MKVVTIAGTRPEWIRLSQIIPKLDRFCDHILVDTMQNYDENLRDIFFEELNIRKPDYKLGMDGKDLGGQLATLLFDLYPVLVKEKPDAFLVLGDTNSSLGAILAKRLGIRVFHLEAGNRCHDPKSPEEVNRKIIDHCTDIHLPYTELSRQNLLREGIPAQKIFVVGNPIKEVIDSVEYKEPVTNYKYLVTLHRQENVDNPERLKEFLKAINNLHGTVLSPMHPRTRKKITDKVGVQVRVVNPLGFKEFIARERSVECVLTDSGTVQEECAIFGVPCVTLRDTTERPETLETGSNIVVGLERIADGIRIATELKPQSVPREYGYSDVSDRVVKIVLGHYV